MNATTYALDIAKSVFQLHWVQPDTGEIHRKKLQRAKLMDFFARLQPSRIVMEACGGAHHWGRELSKLGHQVELLPAHKVKESASGNKDDARDARAIWITATQKDVRRVPVKSVEQQAELFTHRVRSHWVSLRTATVNQLRSMLYEFGLVAPRGRKIVVRWVAEHRALVEQQVPPMAVQLMDQQLQALRELDERIAANERTLQQAQRADDTVRELLKVPGIGPLGASALKAELGDASAYRNSREFACCRGLVPRHTGTGGKVRMAGISKRGDPYLRTLLIHGARSVLRWVGEKQDAHSRWLRDLIERRGYNRAAVALANKNARIIQALLSSERVYRPRSPAEAPA